MLLSASSRVLAIVAIVDAGLGQAQEELVRDMDGLIRRFDRNKSKLETRAQRLDSLEEVTTKMYGVKIKAKPKRRGDYYLKREKPLQLAWERIEDERPRLRQEHRQKWQSTS